MIYRKTGTFLSITGVTGLESLRMVLEEDAGFPAGKQELIEKQGWKVFDLDGGMHVHASILLEKLPDGNYSGIDEIIEFLEKRV